MEPGTPVPAGPGVSQRGSAARPLLRREVRRVARGPCAPLTLPASWAPLPWPSACTWRLRSSAPRTSAFPSAMSGLSASAAASSALGGAEAESAAAGVASAGPVASASVVAADSVSAVAAGPSLLSCFALLVMRSSFAHAVARRVIHLGLSADGPAARLPGDEQGVGLVGADGKLSDADRETRRVLEPDVLDVHPGGPGRVEQPGQLTRAVGDDHLDQAEIPRLPAVLARDAGDPGPAPVEQTGHVGLTGCFGQLAGGGGQVLGHGGDHLGDRAGVGGQDLRPECAV